MIISSSYSDLSCFAISVDQTVHPTDKIKKYLKSIIEHKHIFSCTTNQNIYWNVINFEWHQMRIWIQLFRCDLLAAYTITASSWCHNSLDSEQLHNWLLLQTQIPLQDNQTASHILTNTTGRDRQLDMPLCPTTELSKIL